jgi:hypothetical protein
MQSIVAGIPNPEVGNEEIFGMAAAFVANIMFSPLSF